MVEDHLGDLEDHQKKSSDEMKKELLEGDSDVIELSDIAIGTTPEDDVIVELTEEVIDEAMIGISGATRDSFKEGEEYLDLSKGESDKYARFKDPELIRKKFDDTDDSGDSLDLPAEDEEDHINKELDEFFGPEEETSVPVEKSIEPPITKIQSDVKVADQTISDSNLVDAVETVINKMYGEKINKLLVEVIEKTVNNEIKRIKDFLTGKIQK
jgi:hypothetical protein